MQLIIFVPRTIVSVGQLEFGESLLMGYVGAALRRPRATNGRPYILLL